MEPTLYIRGRASSLRAKSKNFSLEDMKEGVAFAHGHHVRVYVTANILAHNDDLPEVREYFKALLDVGPDALIISDPGVFQIAKEILPQMEIHISTQANNTNYGTYHFWYGLGAKRVVSARELLLMRSGKFGITFPRTWKSKLLSMEPCVYPIPEDAF